MLRVFIHLTHTDRRNNEIRVAFDNPIREVRSYEEAWDVILSDDLQIINPLLILNREDWKAYELTDIFPILARIEEVNFVYYNDRVPSIAIPPSEYNQNTVLDLIRVLDLPYRIEGTEELDG